MSEIFLFPFDMVDKNSQIIIYGAGNVGRQFYNQVKQSNFCTVVLWVDQNDTFYKELRYPVDSIDDIMDKEFDFIVVAIKDEKIALDIRKKLTSEYHIAREKVIWKKYNLLDLFPDYAGTVAKDENQKNIIKIDPKALINSDAMEHMVRYLFCRDIINGVYNQSHISLYQRFVMTSTAAKEALSGQTKAFSDYNEKSGLERYIFDFKQLVASMEKEGFRKECYIPMGYNRYLANGKHRYAAALALEKDIWIREYDSIKGHFKNIDWFRENGFSESDILMILRMFSDLYQQCGMYILYAPVIEHWNYILKIIARHFKIAGYCDLDFKDDYIGFSNLIRDNYSDNEKNQSNIEEKIHYLLMAPLKIRLVLVTDEGMSNEQKGEFYKVMRCVKEEIRNHMFSDTARHTVITHSSDSIEEFEHMKSIWLSTNNIFYAGKRVLFNYGKMFYIMIESLKDYLRKKKIPYGEICILGSAGMELYGLKCADDIDFCISKRYRDYIDENELPQNVHLKRENSTVVEDNNVYSDDLIIEDPEFHYLFGDLKFINLDLLCAMKKKRNLQKDMDDIRRLEVFFDSVKAFDEKRQFRRQMEREIGRIW